MTIFVGQICKINMAEIGKTSSNLHSQGSQFNDLVTGLYHGPCVYLNRAGKSTKCMYLSKRTSNLEKSYSSRSKSTKKIVLGVQVKRKQLYLKYSQKYFY